MTAPAVAEQVAGLTRGQCVTIHTRHATYAGQVCTAFIGNAGALIKIRSHRSGPLAIPVTSIVAIDAPPWFSTADPYRTHPVEN